LDPPNLPSREADRVLRNYYHRSHAVAESSVNAKTKRSEWLKRSEYQWIKEEEEKK
jgi:hypothetical protein